MTTRNCTFCERPMPPGAVRATICPDCLDLLAD
jgi:ribosomal protein L24E